MEQTKQLVIEYVDGRLSLVIMRPERVVTSWDLRDGLLTVEWENKPEHRIGYDYYEGVAKVRLSVPTIVDIIMKK